MKIPAGISSRSSAFDYLRRISILLGLTPANGERDRGPQPWANSSKSLSGCLACKLSVIDSRVMKHPLHFNESVFIERVSIC